MFDETNLYVKIDGRESFYKSYGFKKLYYISLQSVKQESLTIDVELFDLGSSENSLGAFNAENPGAAASMRNGSLSFAGANTGFLAQERYYARILGSDENTAIRTHVQSMLAAMAAQFPAGKLPWTYALFVRSVGVAPEAIKYQKESAFSFGFASDVYSAVVPGSKETEVFVTKRATPGDASKLAKQFAEGFAAFGKTLPSSMPGAVFVNNEFINTVEGVEPYRNYVLGIRFAKSTDEATRWMKRVKAGLKDD
jgi:hypothetical protein